MILATYRRIESISRQELQHLGRQLSALWWAKGQPDIEDMPAIWRHEYWRVKREFERRGEQLTLF